VTAPPLFWKGISTVTLWDARVTSSRGITRVPYYTPNSEPHNAKLFRQGRPGSWWEVSGREMLPYGLEQLPMLAADTTASTLMICEGESDALTVRDTIHAHNDRRVYAIGLPGAGTWRKAWRRFVQPFPVVYTLGDGDAAGGRMANAVLSDIPWGRPVILPSGEDTRSLIQTHTTSALVELLEAADRVAVADAMLTAETIEEAERRWSRVA
jgi:DNA primase